MFLPSAGFLIIPYAVIAMNSLIFFKVVLY